MTWYQINETIHNQILRKSYECFLPSPNFFLSPCHSSFFPPALNCFFPPLFLLSLSFPPPPPPPSSSSPSLLFLPLPPLPPPPSPSPSLPFLLLPPCSSSSPPLPKVMQSVLTSCGVTTSLSYSWGEEGTPYVMWHAAGPTKLLSLSTVTLLMVCASRPSPYGHCRPLQPLPSLSLLPTHASSSSLSPLPTRTELPYNDYFEYFGPDFKLHISPTNMSNQNTPEYLNKIKCVLCVVCGGVGGYMCCVEEWGMWGGIICVLLVCGVCMKYCTIIHVVEFLLPFRARLFENLRLIPHAPSVQMQCKRNSFPGLTSPTFSHLRPPPLFPLPSPSCLPLFPLPSQPSPRMLFQSLNQQRMTRMKESVVSCLSPTLLSLQMFLCGIQISLMCATIHVQTSPAPECLCCTRQQSASPHHPSS